MVDTFNGVMPFDMLLLWEFNSVYGYFFVILFCRNKLLGLVQTGFSPRDSISVQLLVTKKTVNQTRLKNGTTLILRTNFYLSH